MASSVDACFITGIGSLKTDERERMLILMDIESLMASAEMGLVGGVH
jgi:purine-binding chemotaxis protein CheW